MIPCSWPKCKLILTSLADLLNHFNSAHGITALDSVECKLCPRAFTNLQSFKKHFLSAHKKYVSNRQTSSLNTAISGNNDINNVDEPQPECSHSSSSDLIITDATTNNELSRSVSNFISSDISVSQSVCHELDPVLSDEKIQEALEAKVFLFCSQMYSFTGIPMSHAEMTVHWVIDLVQGINSAYKETIKNLSSSLNDESLDVITSSMTKAFSSVESTLNFYKTRYRTVKILKNKGFFFPPKLVTLGYINKRRKFKKKFCVVRTKETSVFIPLRYVLTKFLEQDNVLSNILQYLEKLKTENVIIENVVQGQCWRETLSKCENIGKIILPLFLDNDDIEVGNALGGHAGVQKINATYYFIPCLLPEVRASLNHIFLTLLTKASNLKRYGNKLVFKPVIKELKYLSAKGITVMVDGKATKVFFQLCMLIGDNLGLNTIAGFNQNFSTSHFCCRICSANNVQRKYYTKEVENLLRTVQNYETDVIKKDLTATGIREKCVFNAITNYDIITNGGVDVTHDLFEGCVQYDLCFILKHYIFTTKHFTLAMVNDRINSFNYGSADISNKPPPLPENILKRTTLKMSATETACLLKYFGLLFVNLNVPIHEDDQVWQLYVLLRRIVSIVMSPFVDLKVCDLLASYISEHHSLYLILTKKSLPFKFHSMTHYPRLMVKFGPLVHLCTIRFEHKHRVLKSVSNAVASRRNICYTMARKCQLHLGHNFLLNKFSEVKLLTGPNKSFNDNDRFWNEIAGFVFTTRIPEILRDECSVRTPWVEVKGTRYCEGETLYVEVDEDTSLPIFGFIVNIFVSNGIVYFLLRNFRTISFNEQMFCYELENANSYSVISHESIQDFRPHNAVSVLNRNFFVSLLNDM